MVAYLRALFDLGAAVVKSVMRAFSSRSIIIGLFLRDIDFYFLFNIFPLMETLFVVYLAENTYHIYLTLLLLKPFKSITSLHS